jgi:hypothetical protein
MNCGYGKRENMRYEEKKFGDLQVGECFWTFEPDCGDKELEKIKVGPGIAQWADLEIENVYFYPTKKEVYVPVYDGWYKYLVVACVTIMMILAFAAGAFLRIIMNLYKGL